MTYPHVPAAFINAIAEEGLFGDAIEFLQKQWNETCALRAELKELRGPLGPCTQQEIDAFEGLDPKSRRLFLLWVERAMKAEARAERLRLELEKIAWMDEFLNANGAQAMMQIARDAVNADECSVQAPPKGDAVAWRWRVKGDQNWNLSSRMPAELNDYCEIEPLYAASTTERKALDREEKLLLEEYHSGRLNGNRVIKAAFERLRAALSRSTGSGDAPASTTEREAVAWRWRVKGDRYWNLSRTLPELNSYCEIEPLYATAPASTEHLSQSTGSSEAGLLPCVPNWARK